MIESKLYQNIDSQGLRRRIAKMRAQLTQVDPDVLATWTGANYYPAKGSTGEFHLLVWGRKVIISFPNFIAYDVETKKELRIDMQALVLYHFWTTDGASETGNWISFSELPGGMFYHRAFQSYTGKELVKVFKNDLEMVRCVAKRLGGHKESFGDLSFSFRVLPRVPLMLVYWRGDEEFSPSAKILFDSSVSHHLPTDVCAILGKTLISRLIKAKNLSFKEEENS